jgi:hypothetical protein
MGKLESVMALAGLGVLVVVAAAVVYAVQLLGAERLNVYVMIILIILGVAVFMRGLRWIIEGRHLHEHSKAEKETVREIRILDGRLPHASSITMLPQQSAQIGQIYPEMARAAMQGMMPPGMMPPAPMLNAPAPSTGEPASFARETPASVWDAVGSLVESDQWAY